MASYQNKPRGASGESSVTLTISTTSLPWETLREYLELEFPDVAKDFQQPPEILGLNYVLKLPRSLSNNQAQDIDSLRKPRVAKELLRLLREEKGERDRQRQSGED